MPHFRALTAACALAALTGCAATTGSEGSTSNGMKPTATVRTSANSTSSPATELADLKDLATDLPTPWGIARLGNSAADGYLVSLRDEARIVRVGANGVTAVFGTGPGGRIPEVVPGGEGGLLGIALAPEEPNQKYTYRQLYAYLTSATDNRVVSMEYRNGELSTPRPVLTGIPKASTHNGGRIAFGPDGYLYVATGDAAEPNRAQDRNSLGGKILRITPEGKPAPGNPFPDSLVWSWGHRNVQGIAWDDQGRMYASEFGQNTWDELNRIEPGGNYGWPIVEGKGTPADETRGYTPPLAQWSPADASPSGIAIGSGSIWMAALRGERLWRIPLSSNGSTGKPVSLLDGEYGRLRAVDVAPDGTLAVITSNVTRGQGRLGDDRMVTATLG
ncbi:MAG: PQQ-dependent sugar dehydrogenase [Actinomycetota bacterium]